MDEIIFYRDSELPEKLEGIDNDILQPICNALQNKHILKIKFEKYPDEYEIRSILPEVIFFYLDEWYVAAYCYLRKEPRTFRFDHIAEVVETRIKGKSHGIAEEYRKNGIPWKSSTGKRLPVLNENDTDIEFEEPPPYHPITDEERRLRNANIELLRHAGQNDICGMKKDLAAGADVNFFDGQDTPLIRAVESDGIDAVKFLLKHGADITIRDGARSTVLFRAAWSCRDEMVRFLVKKYQCSPNDKNCHGWTALTAAADHHSYQTIRYLLRHGADINTVDGEHMNTIMFLLHYPISNSRKCLKTIRLLVEKGIDLNYQDKKGRNALFYAIEKEEVEIIRFLLRAGIDVNARDKYGKTPLLAAMEAFREERYSEQFWHTMGVITEDAFRKKSNSWITKDICKKREKIVRILCDAGADVNAADPDGVTPLMLSTRKIFDLLWKRGADIHAKDHRGRTVAHYHAVNLRHIDMLAKAGLDLFAKDKDGSNVMMAAPCELKYIRHFIEKYGFTVNERNNRMTLLHRAATEECNPETVQYLLEHGADADALNYNKRTALEQLLQDDPYAYDSSGEEKEIYDLLDDFTDKKFTRFIRACRALDLETLKDTPPEILDRYANRIFGPDGGWNAAIVVGDAWCCSGYSVPASRIEAIFDLLTDHGADLLYDPYKDGNCLISYFLLEDRSRWAKKYLDRWLEKHPPAEESLESLIRYHQGLDKFDQDPEMIEFLMQAWKERTGRDQLP